MLFCCSTFPKDRFVNEGEIGHGTYGRVYKVFDTTTQRTLAMKKANIDLSVDGVPSPFLRELVFLRQLDHPNIIKLEEIIMTVPRLYLFFEYMEMDLKQLLERTEAVDEGLIRRVMLQVLSGLDYMRG